MGLIEVQNKQNDMTREIAQAVYAGLGKSHALVLSAGGCTICEACALANQEPCRYPEDAMASLEAYEFNVTLIGEVSSLRCINGANTVTYFGGVLT